MRRRPCRGNKRRPLSFVSIFGAAVEGGSDCNFGAGQGGAGPGGGECDGRAPERKKPAAGAAAPGAVRRFVRGAPNVTRLRPPLLLPARPAPSPPPTPMLHSKAQQRGRLLLISKSREIGRQGISKNLRIISVLPKVVYLLK